MSTRRGPSPVALAAAQVKRDLRALGMPHVHVRSDPATRTVTVAWLDGLTEAAVRQAVRVPRMRVVCRRTYSDAACLEALGQRSEWVSVQRWLAGTDLTVLSDWAVATARLLAAERVDVPSGSGWPRLRVHAAACRGVPTSALDTATRLRLDGSALATRELVATALLLEQP